MTAEAPHSRNAARFAAHAALLLALGLAACSERETAPQAGKAETVAPADATDASIGAPATPTAAPAAIGRVHSMEGDVRILGPRGEERAQAGVLIERGETIKTLPEAWVLLAMNDGASITVRADSELRFDEYRYVPDGEPQQNSAAISLVKGALRSITGLIGQTNRAGYRIATPNATIGIRGTDHEPAYYPAPPPGRKAEHPPGTYDKVNEGESVIRLPAGEVPVRRGQTAFAPPEPRARPQLLARPPVFYQRYAEVDRRVVEPRRVELHRQFVQDEQRRQEQRRQQLDTQKKAQEQRRQAEDREAQRKGEREQAREKREAANKKRDEERKAQQDARTKKQEERRQERDARKEKKAEGKDEDRARSEQKKGREEKRDARAEGQKKQQQQRAEQREAAQKQRQEQSQRAQQDRARQPQQQQQQQQERARQQQQQQQERMRRQQEEQQQERLRQQQQERARQRQQVPQR